MSRLMLTDTIKPKKTMRVVLLHTEYDIVRNAGMYITC